MHAVCASAAVLAVCLAPILCLAEVHITTSRQNAENLREHGSLTLECRSTDSHADWTHNDQPVSNTTGRFVVVENKTPAGGLVSSLTIVNAEPEDAGTYTCSCPHSRTVDSISVIVTGQEHHSRVMIDGPKEVEKTLGSQLQLTCKADIHSSVEWLLNGKRLAKSTNDVITTREDENRHQKTVLLVRNNLAAHDFGFYVCRNVRDNKDGATVHVKNPSASSTNGFRRHKMETAGLVILLVVGMMIAMAQ